MKLASAICLQVAFGVRTSTSVDVEDAPDFGSGALGRRARRTWPPAFSWEGLYGGGAPGRFAERADLVSAILYLIRVRLQTPASCGVFPPLRTMVKFGGGIPTARNPHHLSLQRAHPGSEMRRPLRKPELVGAPIIFLNGTAIFSLSLMFDLPHLSIFRYLGGKTTLAGRKYTNSAPGAFWIRTS